jgi:predicted secreted protein
MLYNGGSLRLATTAGYSWEMALNVGLNVSFDNM